MWTGRCEDLADARGLRFEIAFDTRPATFADVLRGWREDAGFRTMFNALLSDAPFEAFRWETPAVTTDTMSRPFEFVILDSPDLSRPPDPEAFAEHFQRTKTGVSVFPNLKRDAVMIEPAPRAEPSAYGHLAAFVRHAPEAQRHALWQSVGESMTRRVGDKPVWLSTAGAGVAWLHLRLDDQPKYYWFDPYQRFFEKSGDSTP